MAATMRRDPGDCSGVLVGLSGGVDSAVAAMLLKEQGHEVVAVTLRLWADPTSGDKRTGSSPKAIDRARLVAESLGLQHLVVDAAESFYSRVVEYFVDEYARGRTPNPCVKCNSRLRFQLLLDTAHQLGLASIATGHYARLSGRPARLRRGADPSKDQSYVLAEVAPALLRQTIFPLGEMTKVDVRARALEAGLPVQDTPESQEICFVPDDDHRRFLRERLGSRPGVVVDKDGKVLGHHDGTYNFTIGQRRGLGLSRTVGEPRYVIAVAPDRDEVVVGDSADIAVGRLAIGEVVHHAELGDTKVAVQVRSTGGAVPARVIDRDTVVLEEPAVGVAPGQTAVVYEGDAVALAGTILSTEVWPDVAAGASPEGKE